MKINPASYEARIAIQKEIFAHLEAVVAIGNHYKKVRESGFWTDLPADTKTITYYYKVLQQAGYDIPAALKWELLQVEIT
ncbi:MAG TPA: hypothetical protein VEX63_01510, partial [Flavisolibacter sp.]|nr:hypothetical protein [Flavisolibacter sp.]